MALCVAQSTQLSPTGSNVTKCMLCGLDLLSVSHRRLKVCVDAHRQLGPVVHSPIAAAGAGDGGGLATSLLVRLN